MAVHKTLVRSVRMPRAVDAALLGGVSLLALMVGSDLAAARGIGSTAAVAPTMAAQQAAMAAAQQAAGAAAQAQASLGRAAAALAAMRKLQLDAAAAAQASPSSVPNGLVTGGLMPMGGTAGDPSAGIRGDPTKWIGADLPTWTTNGSQATVNIHQTQQKGLFYWDTFNVGSNTTVNFQQSQSDWIALNRISNSTAPSQIFGHINALGAVYIINRNGIIFGAGSQVNVHTLVASSLDIGQLGTDYTGPNGRDPYYLNTGIANLNSFSIYDFDKDAAGKATLVAGDVKVERGASITANITTDQVPLGSPGSVYLFGANVYNSGAITVPTGEVGMVAARTIDLVPNGYSVLPSVVGTFRGTEFRISQFASSYQSSGASSGYPNGQAYLPGTGAVTHDGLIEASRGIVVMNGDKITIDNPRDASGQSLIDATGRLVQGVISVDTSIDRNSMVMLRAATSVSMNGVISSLPFDDGAPPLPSGTSSGSTVQAFTPAYIEMSAQSSVTVGSSGLVSAPSAQVSLRAINLSSGAMVYDPSQNKNVAIYQSIPGLFNQGMDSQGTAGNPNTASNTPSSPQTVLLAPGATIDVAGLQNVALPVSYNFVSFQPRAEFADMPLQRNGVLYGQTLWIDIRASGTRSDGTSWVGTPLADASGVVNAVGRSISQLMTVGGSVNLQTDLNVNNGAPAVQTAGSVINVAGGSVKFLPGMVPVTRLLGIDGRIHNMENADPNMIYVGIAGQFTRIHFREWNVTETWSTGTQTFAPGYSEGHDAGSLSVTAVTPSLLGTILFGSVAGERQINSGLLPLQGSLALTTPSSVQVGPAASADYTTQSAYTTTLSADTLSGYGLSALSVTANDLVVSSGSTLNLAPGGSFSATTGGAIDIAGTVSAAGGAINLVTDRNKISSTFAPSLFKAPTDQSGAVIAANVFVAGTLDVSGRFVNDSGRTGTDMSGPGFINGGTISIATNKVSDNLVDKTGSILLARSSILDVSSGGYISPLGKPKTSTGVMAGKAGSISLRLYQGLAFVPVANGIVDNISTPTSGSVAVLQLDGSLLGHGFQSNGSLTLGSADTIRIGGTLQPGETSGIRIGGVSATLPVVLLTGGGFGAYTIESFTDDWSGATGNVIVSSGVNLTLQQQNLSRNVDYTTTATGTKLGQQTTPALAMLPDDQRQPVNLALKANNILLDSGATIVTDPKASITLGNVSADRTLDPSNPIRNAPAKSVELRGSIIDHGGTVFINAVKTHLGAQALVDVSGAFVANSGFGARGGPATSGTYLAGGTFAVEAGAIKEIDVGQKKADGKFPSVFYDYGAPDSSSYLVADAGALVDVSGSAGAVQVAAARGATSSVWSWSDAGTVSADVSGLAWGGSFGAMGGRYLGTDGNVHADPRANGGTVILGGGNIRLRQDMTDVSDALSSFHLGAPQSLFSLFIAADQLAPFDNVYLYAATATGGAKRIFTDLPGNIYGYDPPVFKFLSITGAIDWNVANRLHIAASAINAATAVNARLSAPYVLLTGGGFTPVAGSSTLTVNAQAIDVEGAAFSGFGQVNLISSGDLRLSTPKVANGVFGKNPDGTAANTPTELSTFSGSMLSAGDLLLSAQRIYPVSAVNFSIQTPGNVTFTAPAGSSTAIPLSAGGGITVIANTIDQAGNLFAPLGKITLGNTDSTVSAITTQSVILEPGSLTSVTLADMLVPYGATTDGTNWYYNANLNPLSAPPTKGLVLAGTNVKRSAGSTIDLRGGGDLQAMEWIQGKGGSRDTLTTTPSGQTVYALVPSASDPIAAFDIHFAAARSADAGNTVTAGDVSPLAGTQITIDGGNGIPAGTYTLYPAHYATLPGAMRVVYYGDNIGRNLPSGAKLPDGTVLVAGQFTQSTAPGKQSSGQSLFAVQTNAVWQQYSEYSFNGANTYFTQLAAKRGIAVPRLPMDAGRLSAFALQSIVLNGIALTQPGQDSSGNIGRGAELDVSAPKVAVVGNAQYLNNDIPAGYVGLDIAQLNGFESVLIGGIRADTTTGTMITPSASSVVVDTGGETFSAPEILLVAKTVLSSQQTISSTLTSSQTDPTTHAVIIKPGNINVTATILTPDPLSGTVTIAAGSVIATTGIVHAGAGRNYYLAGPTAQDVAAALGGTLYANGTIVGADLSKLGYTVTDANGIVISNNVGTMSAADRATLQNYAAQTGALFVATNDTSLKVSGPGGMPLTIQFKPVSDPNLTRTDPTNPATVSGSLGLPLADAGKLSIGLGANITTKALTLQATAATDAIVINSNALHVGQLNVTARSIGLGSPTPLHDKSVALYNQQFADVGALAVRALSGTITLYGDYNPGLSVTSLTLDAPWVVRADGTGNASISDRGSLTLVNTGPAPATTAVVASPASSGILCIGFCVDPNGSVLGDTKTVILGGGTQTILGYGQVNLNAIDHVFVAGPGTMTLGAGNDAVDFNVATPNILVGGATGAGSFALTTSGNIAVVNSITRDGIADRPADSAEIGGNLALTAASISIGTTIQAQAGTIKLDATQGDVTLNPRAYLAAGGAKKTLVDRDTFVAGGKVMLTADKGNVTTDLFSVIDVAQPAGGLGYGGEVDVTATGGNATLAGFLFGGGGGGLGGSFKLDIKGPADLTAIADKLLFGGISGAIDIHTRTGNLVLAENHTLKANAITLTADDPSWVGNDVNQQFGKIYIGGLVDASGYGGTTPDGTGEAGGQVAIYAANSVLLASAGKIDASTTHSDERGGDVTVGIGWGANGKIYLQTGTQIDVSGGTRGGLSGGTVTFRAPRDGNNDAKIAGLSAVRNSDGAFFELPTIDDTTVTITGARSVTVDAFVAFDTQTSSHGIDGSGLGWNGRIDPAGWYNRDGSVATSGSWTNVSGWTFSSSDVSTISGFTSLPTQVTLSGGGGSGATLGNFSMGVNFFFPASNPGFAAGQTNIPVIFPTPAGGVAAQGTASVDAAGRLSIRITNRGSGYTSPPTTATVGSFTVSAGSSFGNLQSNLTIVSAQVTNPGRGYDGSSPLLASVRGGGGIANITFRQASNFSGTGSLNSNNTVTFTPATTDFIPWTSSGVFGTLDSNGKPVLFNPAAQGTPGVAGFTGGATSDRPFFADTLAQVAQGTWTDPSTNKSYGFSQLFTRLNKLGSNDVHVQVQPGIELVNSGTGPNAINHGDITVLTNWNLAAGTAGNLQPAKFSDGTAYQYFDPKLSYVNFSYRLVTPWGGLEAPDLTLRATGNINVNASISDGFFQFGNYLDSKYQTDVANYYTNVVKGSSRVVDGSNAGLYAYYLNSYSNSTAVPIAPYKADGNAVSPTATDLASADLFPHMLLACTVDCSSSNIKSVTAPSSSSYNFTAGADAGSANPAARITLKQANDLNTGDVIVDKHGTYNQTVIADTAVATSSATVNLPTMVRTGTGKIAIAAARDVRMNDTVAPGVIYAAGVNTAKLADPNYSTQSVNGVPSLVVAGNPDGFFEPQVLAYGNGGLKFGNGAGLYDGPPTAAAFPEQGGDVEIYAQQDIVGYSGSGNKALQYYQPWLLSDTAAISGKLFGAGLFTPSGTKIGAQTAWWIQYGSFQQGILSAGGNVDLIAGRDLVDVSVSLPTTGRVSGGLTATSTPVTHIYGSGNMVVRAGGNILGGSFYEGSGHASIVAGGAIGQNGTVSRYASSKLLLADVPLLAVDTGQIEMVARGSITMAGVVNPAELHAQQSNAANPVGPQAPLYMATYGPDSKVRLVADTGDLTITIAPPTIRDTSNSATPVNAAAAMYPASFEALALSGNLITTGIGQITTAPPAGQASSVPMPGIVLSPSQHGTFELMAQGSVDLSFGYPKAPTTLFDGTPRPFITAGPALIDTAFDPFQPNSGFDVTGSVLAHQDDAAAGLDTIARIYAATGDITATGGHGPRTKSDTFTGYQRIEINRPTRIYAGRDIVDLNVIVQNIHSSDVSSIEAGRNIQYTGFNNGGGLQVAGPGFFVVQAGGDIGPFLPSFRDNAQDATVQEGIASVGNSSTTPVGQIYVSGAGSGSVGSYDEALLGPVANPRRNALLTVAAGTARGADIVTLFGTKFGIDYHAVISTYIDPTNAAGVDHNYISELEDFLERVGKPANPLDQANLIDQAAVFNAFKSLPADLQQVFVDQVFFAELKAVGISQKNTGTAQFQRGYKMINTMFPSSLGYTADALGGGTNGANQLVKTGDLNLLHGTIQTQLGGDISIFGPGGNLVVGSLAAEPNPKLKLRDIGILTLGGGAINAFTDESVLVNASRVLTTQGGDVLMWSSNGNLDAGRGSKTTLSAPALQVQFDQNDYQSIDLGGFVTGSGIGTVLASTVATPSDLFLLAPRGTIDFGSAGVRASGNAVFAAPVVANASNAQVQGTTSGLPVVSVPSLGAVTSGNNAAGAAAKSADSPTGAGGKQDRASVFMVEVIGYGGGDNQSQPPENGDSKPPADGGQQPDAKKREQ